MKPWKRLFSCLDELGISYVTTEHAAAFTVEQGEAVWHGISGIHCKNLFLKDAKKRLWLVVAPHDRVINLKELPKKIASARLSFGPSSLLKEILGVEPGSVTPFGLINDTEKKVTVILDSWMMKQPLLNYHPLVNTATTTILNTDFSRFLSHCGHKCKIVDLMD